MTTNLLEAILSNTFIKNQAEKKVMVLKDYLLDNLFAQGKKTATDEWVTSLDKKVLESITPQNVYSVFDKMEADIKAIEPLVLYLPYELPETEIVQIGTSLRSDYGASFLIEITIDPNLIAGCALSFKGIYKDYSLKQKIADNKQAILETFRKYVKH